MRRTKRLVLDTETTGLKPGTDEILTLSIIDGDGEVEPCLVSYGYIEI